MTDKIIMTDEIKEEMKETLRYFQNFHHKCVGWYITIFGFFIAGTIVVGQPIQGDSKIISWSIIVSTFIFSGLFYRCIFHYSARIEKLGRYLSGKEQPTKKWYDELANCGRSISGRGSQFFFSIILVMQATVVWLIYLKYPD